MFRVIIAGSRSFQNYELLAAYTDFKLSGIRDTIEIISGGASGADTLAIRYAKERGYEVRVFPADWQNFGSLAGYQRNLKMADHADALIAFWDGKSRGTAHMIRVAEEKKLRTAVKIYSENT